MDQYTVKVTFTIRSALSQQAGRNAWSGTTQAFKGVSACRYEWTYIEPDNALLIQEIAQRAEEAVEELVSNDGLSLYEIWGLEISRG